MRFTKPTLHYLWVTDVVKVGEYFFRKKRGKNLPPSLDNENVSTLHIVLQSIMFSEKFVLTEGYTLVTNNRAIPYVDVRER